MTKFRNSCVLVSVCFLVACSGPLSILVEGSYPRALTSPLPVSATLVMNEEFRNYIASPQGKISLNLGAAQTEMFEAVMKPRFSDLLVVSERPETITTDWVIEPSVSSTQIGVPAITHLKVYEVWLKYRVNVGDQQGNEIASWFVPAYGKSPNSFTQGRGAAIQLASEIALRDLGARVITDLHRVPELNARLRESGF
ncbi:MAG: hypothetical protein AB8B81_03550 [Halioglobus sp.]